MYIEQVKGELLDKMMTNDGQNLFRATFDQPVMLVFLRHFACVFCREAMTDLAARKTEIDNAGTKLIFVHMATHEIAEEYFEEFNLTGVSHISDPSSEFYRAFGLGKGTFKQLFGLSTWIRGYDIVVNKNIPIKAANASLGDSFQMPGVFILQAGAVKEAYIHKLASDRPDYEKLMECCIIR